MKADSRIVTTISLWLRGRSSHAFLILAASRPFGVCHTLLYKGDTMFLIFSFIEIKYVWWLSNHLDIVSPSIMKPLGLSSERPVLTRRQSVTSDLSVTLLWRIIICLA